MPRWALTLLLTVALLMAALAGRAAPSEVIFWGQSFGPDSKGFEATIREFERLCKDTGLQIATRDLVGFNSSTIGPLTQGLAHLPVTREFFCSRVIYRLQK